MHTRQLTIPAGIAVAVITAIAPATAAQAHSGSSATSVVAAHHGHGHGHSDGRSHGAYRVRGEVKSFDPDTGTLAITTSSGTTITGTVTKHTKVWIKSSSKASSVRAQCHDSGDRAAALAALDPGADVKAVFSRSGAIKSVEIEK